MDSHKYKPSCHMVNNVMSDQSPVRSNYLSYYKSKKSISGRRMIVSPNNPESRFIEDKSVSRKRPCYNANRLASRSSGSDLCLEDAQNSVNESLLTTATQDSVYDGRDLNYVYDTIADEKSLFTSSEMMSFAARDRVVESQQNVSFKKAHDHENMPNDLLNKSKSCYPLLTADDSDVEPRKSSTRFERVFGDNNDVAEYSGINARLSSRRLFLAQENPKERSNNKDTLNPMDIAECNHRYSYIDRSRNLFGLNEKIMDNIQVTFPDKCGGNLQLVSRATGRIQSRQPQQDNEVYASYIPDHCRKNRRGRHSNKASDNSRKDHYEFDLNSSHKDVGTATVCVKKANRPIFSNKEEDFFHTPLASLYGRRNTNVQMSDETEERSYFTQNSESLNESNKKSEFSGNRASTEKGSRSVDKSRRHRSCIFGDDLNEDSKLNRSIQQPKHRATKRRQRSFFKDTPFYIQSTYSKRQPYNECKKNKPWRASSKEIPDGEYCCPEIKRNEIPSDYKQWRAQDVPNPLNTEDILSRPPWTCTKWASEVFTNRRQKPTASKWAYEVYSDTCLRASNEDLSTGSNSKACTDVNEELCPLEISNENLQEQQLERPDFLNHVLCVNNLAVHGIDYSRRMIRCSTVLAARQKARLTPYLVSNSNPLNLDQMLSESMNPSHEMCLQLQAGESDAVLGAIRERKSMDTVSDSIINIKNTEDGIKKDTIDRNNQKEESSITSNAERETVSTEAADDSIRNENICFKKSAIQIDISSDGRNIDSAGSKMLPNEFLQCSVDEKLARTVHAIKEDIEGVFNRLSSLDDNTNKTATKPVLDFQDEATAVGNKAADTEKDVTITRENNVEIVESASAKLAVLSSTFGTSSSNEEDNQNNRSYDLYKAGKERYNDVADNREYDYDITVFPIDCAKHRNSNLQGFNPVIIETSAMPIVARTLSPGRKCSRHEEIYMLLKENNEMKEIKQNSRSSSLLLTENDEHSATESSECITISENNIYPSTTDSRVSHKSSRKLLVTKYSENLSNASTGDLGDGFIRLTQSATSDTDVSPQMQRTLQSVATNEAGVRPTRNRKKRKGSLTNRIKKKFLEMFDYSSNLNEDSNERTPKTKSQKKRKSIIKDIELSLGDKGGSENYETYNINEENINSKPAAENNPNIFSGNKKLRRMKSKSRESTISSSVTSMPTTDNENWSVTSSPTAMKKINRAKNDVNESTESESTANPMCRETSTEDKSAIKNKRTSQYQNATTRDVQIVYNLRSKTSMTESESSFTNTVTVRSKEKIGEISANKNQKNGRLSASDPEIDSEKEKENQSLINKSRLSPKEVSLKKTSTRNTENCDDKADKFKEMQQCDKSSNPIQQIYVSTRPLKKTHIYENNHYIIECVEKCHRNKCTLKGLESCDGKTSSRTSLISSSENSEAINEKNRSEKLDSCISVKNYDTTSASATSSTKHFSKKHRPDVQGRRISRKRVELKLRSKDSMNGSQTSDTSSLLTSTNVTKEPVTPQKGQGGLQSPTKVLRKTSVPNNKYGSKHRTETARNKANEILLNSPKRPPTDKSVLSKQGKVKANESREKGLIRKVSPDKEDSRPTAQTKQNNALVVHKDNPSAISASQLNISIMKLYEEINKLRAQLEASTDDLVSRHSPPIGKLSSYGVVSPIKEMLDSREMSPKTSDRSTSMSFSSYREYKSASESLVDFDPADDRYFGAPRVTPKDPDSTETIKVSHINCASVCCMYQKYSGENKNDRKEYLVDRNETGTAESSLYVDHIHGYASGLDKNIEHIGDRRQSPRCYSEETDGGERYVSDYWSEHQNLAAAAGDFYDDTDAGPDGIESLDDDNDGRLGTVSSVDRGLETDKSGENKFQDYIFNNLPLHAGSGRAYARGIFPTAALESKQSVSQISSLAYSQHGVSDEYSSQIKGSAANDLDNSAEMQGSLKCKMEPSQPDLWPHRFVFTNNNIMLNKDAISSAIAKSIQESEGHTNSAANGSTDMKEENSNLKSSSLELINKSEYDIFDEDNATKCANVHTDVLHFDDIVKLSESPQDASLSANQYTSANEYFYTSSANSEERRSPKQKPAAGNMSFESNSMPMWSETEESPVTSRVDYIPPSHVPRIVQCVRDMLFGSTKADTTDPCYGNPAVFDHPRTSSRMKYSPISETKYSDSRKRNSNGSGQQNYQDDHVGTYNETQGKCNSQDEFSKGSDSPKLENCTFRDRAMRNIANTGSSVDKSHRTLKQRPTCDIEKINERSPCYSEELLNENEKFSSYIKENSFTTSQSSNSRISPKSIDSCNYSPMIKEFGKADMVIRHYSDAINANGSKRLSLAQEPNLGNISNVSSSNQICSERSFSDLTSNDNNCIRTFAGSVEYLQYDRPSKSSHFERVHENNMSRRRAPTDAEWNGRDRSSATDKSRVGEKRLFASFDNLLQPGKACYVEHCGFRQRKLDDTLTEYRRIDELGGLGGEMTRNEEEVRTASREQVSNDNNSSDIVKGAEAKSTHCEFTALFGNDNELIEDNEKLCKRSDMFDVVNFHGDRHMSMSQSDDYSTDSGRSDDCGNDNDLSNYNDTSNIHENMEINDDVEADDEGVENEDNIDERRTILDASDEMPENFSDDENNEANISTRNTTFDEDEKENWYKTTDEESNI